MTSVEKKNERIYRFSIITEKKKKTVISSCLKLTQVYLNEFRGLPCELWKLICFKLPFGYLRQFAMLSKDCYQIIMSLDCVEQWRQWNALSHGEKLDTMMPDCGFVDNVDFSYDTGSRLLSKEQLDQELDEYMRKR